MKLTVTVPFGAYVRGQQITDLLTIAAILNSDQAAFVVATGDGTMQNIVTGQLAATGRSSPINAFGTLNISMWAADPNAPVTANVVPERSFDGGTTWLPVTDLDRGIAFADFPMSTKLIEGEPGVLYSLNCTAFSGGIINYRLSRA